MILMPRDSQLSLPPTGLTSVDPATRRQHVCRSPRATSVDHDEALALLRRAVHDCSHTLDSLAAHMKRGRAYIGKVLQGEKPLSYRFVVDLPDDVEGRFEQLRARHFGYIVAAPVGDAATAAEQFFGGLHWLIANGQVTKKPAA